jgi:vitamin B12 transporter
MTPEIKYNLRTAATVGLALLCAAYPARSQDSDENEIHTLDRFVVVANRHEVPIDKVGSSVEILESYDLEKGSQSFLLDFMREVPGFYLRNNGGPGGTFGITTRGLNSNRPTVLIDGIKVSNPANGQIINFGNLYGSNISRVEILKGPQSSLYGADALAGVISIQTSDDSTGGAVELSAGSYNTYEASISLNGNEEALNWSFNASRYDTKGFSAQPPSFGPEWADNDGYENTSFSGKLGYDIGEDAELFLVAYYIDSFSEFDPGTPAPWLTNPNPNNHSESKQLFAKLGGKFQLTDTWNSQISMAHSDVDTLSFTGTTYASDGDRYEFDWQNTIELNKRWTLVAGAEYELEDNRTDIGDRDNQSYYIENIVGISDQLDWTLGGRYDDNSAYGDKTTWRSSFSYQVETVDARLHGSYGTSFQAPSFYQLFNPTYGNTMLIAETGEGWDFGFEKTFAEGKFVLSSTLFGYEIEDKINFSFDTYLYGNEEFYESEGVETSARWELSESLRLTAGHTYSSANYGDGTEAERVPRNLYSLNANWRGLENKLGINATLLNVSSQRELLTSTTRQPGYTVVNVATQYQINENYQVWVRIDNLFDEDYQEIVSYQTPGISYYTGVRFTF